MKKKLLIVLLVTFILALGTVTLVMAGDGQPQGGCPNDFQLHSVMDHTHDHGGQHRHVGNGRDLNGDGWICGKHVSSDGSVHVHIDNNVTLP
jgi:hypothetical protein